MYIPSSEDVSLRSNRNELGSSINYDVNLFNEFTLLQKKDTNFTLHYYWNTDGHLKPAGYNLTAQILSLKIKEKYVHTH